MNKIGVTVGRFCPLHNGHQNLIQAMINEHTFDNCVTFIGSSNSPLRWRVLFDYKTRRRWLKRIFNNLRVIGLPDSVNDDVQWFQMLDDYITAIWPEIDACKDVIYYAGSEEDVNWYYTHGRKHVKIIDRTECGISATQIRQLLLNNDNIDNYVDPRLKSEIIELFNKQLKKLDELRGETF